VDLCMQGFGEDQPFGSLSPSLLFHRTLHRAIPVPNGIRTSNASFAVVFQALSRGSPLQTPAAVPIWRRCFASGPKGKPPAVAF